MLDPGDIKDAAIEGAVQRLRPKLMTVGVVLASLIPILWESGVGFGCDEADRCADCRRHDHIHDSRVDLGPRLFRDAKNPRLTTA